MKTIAGNGKNESKDGIGLDAGIYGPRKVVFYRSPTAKPNSILYFTSEDGCVRRLDIESGAVSTVKLPSSAAPLAMWSLDCAPSGHLIAGCRKTHSLFLIDPASGDIKLLAGSGEVKVGGFADGSALQARFGELSDLILDESERCFFVADGPINRIRRVNLPASLVAVVFGTDQSIARPISAVPFQVVTVAGNEKKLTEIKGSRDGIGAAASLHLPYGIARSASSLLFSEFGSTQIRRLIPQTGMKSTRQPHKCCLSFVTPLVIDRFDRR